jgi:hypothetical protein
MCNPNHRAGIADEHLDDMVSRRADDELRHDRNARVRMMAETAFRNTAMLPGRIDAALRRAVATGSASRIC